MIERELRWRLDSSFRFARLRVSLRDRGWLFRPLDDRQIVDLYWDTDDGALNRAGLACRLRRSEDGAEVEIKAEQAPEGELQQRQEWPIDAPADTASLGRSFKKELRERFRLRLARPLRPCLRICNHRKRLALRSPSGIESMLVVDAVRVRPPGEEMKAPTTFTFHELEWELLDGEATTFVEECTEALSSLRLERADANKLVQGRRLLGLERPRPPKPRFPPSLPLGQVALAVLRYQFERMTRNEGGTRVGLDPEYLHDMRVATRRMRAALEAFGSVFRQADLRRFDKRLRWLADLLGQVRDLDVQVEELPRRRQSVPEVPHGLDLVETRLLESRDRARENMLDGLDGARYQDFLRDFRSWLREDPLRKRPAPDALVRPLDPVAPAAALLLAERIARTLDRGRRARKKSTDRRLHKLRIACKKTRYLVEFFRPLMADEGALPFLKAMVALQDLIGMQHDAVVAQERLRGLLSDCRKDERAGLATGFALGRLLALEEERARSLRAALPAAWKTFRQVLRSPDWQSALQALDPSRT